MKTPGSAEGAALARTHPVLRRLSPSLVALAFTAFAASALAGSHAVTGAFQLSGSITNSDPVVTNPWHMTTRNSCPTQSSGLQQVLGTFHYDVYRFQNLRGAGGEQNSASACVNVSLLVHSGTAAATGYRRAFEPIAPDAWVGGSVGGLGAGQSGDFGYPIDPVDGEGPVFDVVVWETIANGGATYTLVVEGIGVMLVSGGVPTATTGLQSFRASSAPKGVLVRWRTRSEGDALGFNVYRGDVKKVRLTRSIVRASGDGRGHSYSYIDRTARKGKTAPYYLQVVQRGGSKIMFGPAVTAR